ncbi:rhodanese-like domain-containing protein [Methyloversatilis sp.]|uniref:rhodanese-like domain-containing protein n=1 Tax=Methyloversatilis sp. TaxID=2569862 RepID=UPI0027349472|nr:rhodanese-like domain-containing protein [Methyloversatilis sp.]MDP2867564.1 rhodanese-like domain-containing protein [Methyloversatilis sp.]MDP3456015.1 rhodanese-like domain-containing protein [Methyloversatilis sp.]MDP3579771.1 rhodanese-like domain-containing protein [Methyloversatilis sp.]
MFFQRLKTPGLGHNAYLLGCGDGLAVVIDPRRDVDDYLRLARENDLSIAYVLETHRQEDFEFGSRTLAQMTGARIVGGRHALFGETDVKLADEEELKVGTTRFIALATPGHTPESMSYAVYVKDGGDRCWGVFTGDALFVGDTGRTDLPDPGRTADNAGILYDAIHRKIEPLGEHVLLFPAHGAGSACGGNISERDDSTLGIEKATNPVFLKSRHDFVAHKLAEKMARPPYFVHMEDVNRLPGRPLKSPSTFRVLQPVEFQQRMHEGVVIDTRSPEAFSAAHIPGAYNIWLDGLPAFGGWVANENTRIFLVADGLEAMERAVMSLARIGIDSVEGVLAKGIEGWRDQGLPIESIATTSAAETAIWMQLGRVQVLDVRDEYEWNEKHIPGAMHRYVGHLESDLPLLPRDSEIVVHCNVGHRSGVAASILKRNGFTRVHNMLGGLSAWEKLGLPLDGPGQSRKAD